MGEHVGFVQKFRVQIWLYLISNDFFCFFLEWISCWATFSYKKLGRFANGRWEPCGPHNIAAPTLPAVICKWRGLKMLRFSIISIWLPISALNFRIFSKMLYFLVWWSFTYSWKFVFGIFYCKFGRKFSIIEFYAWKAAALIMKSSTTCTTSKTLFLEFYKLLISAPIKNQN